MLKRFEVGGFKNFANRIVLDFTDVRDYQFSTNCIKSSVLNKIIVYGKNAVGKTNLGLAIFDITAHLAENNITPVLYDFYLNADKDVSCAEFRYVFQFEQSEIAYTYRKSDLRELLYEEILIDSKLVFSYDFQTDKGNFEGLKEYAPSLNFEFKEKTLSVLRYVVSNSKSEDVPLLSKLIRFVSKMLWFRSLNENRYVGYKSNSSDFSNFIFEGNNLKKFEDFLNKAGIREKLRSALDVSNNELLLFDKKKPIPFFKSASSGTLALYTIFYWLMTSKELSFLFIDEFDAYYHVELSEAIVTLLEERKEFQTILTSHNTNLLSNRIMRPDCYFILTAEKLVSFANATKRELREGHNLEKLYNSGEFDG